MNAIILLSLQGIVKLFYEHSLCNWDCGSGYTIVFYFETAVTVIYFFWIFLIYGKFCRHHKKRGKVFVRCFYDMYQYYITFLYFVDSESRAQQVYKWLPCYYAIWFLMSLECWHYLERAFENVYINALWGLDKSTYYILGGGLILKVSPHSG